MADSPVLDESEEFIPMPLPGGVVRQEEADELTPVPFQFSDIRALAAKILKRAQEQAQQKLEAARTQIAALEKEAQDKAYQEGLAKGEKAGFTKGETEGKAASAAEIKKAVEAERSSFQKNTAPVATMLEQLANAINEQRQIIIAQAEGDLLLLAIDLAKRLVGRELSLDREAIRPIANEAIGLVTDRSSILVRVNPDDLKVMEDDLPSLKNYFPDLGAVHLEADPSVERGGIIAATREAEVDMRLATRLAAFEEAILGFSGKDAEAPWDRVDPAEAERQLAAIEAAKAAARQASPFSLPGAAVDAIDSEHPLKQPYEHDSVIDPEATPDAVPPVEQAVSAEDAAPAEKAPAPAPESQSAEPHAEQPEESAEAGGEPHPDAGTAAPTEQAHEPPPADASAQQGDSP